MKLSHMFLEIKPAAHPRQLSALPFGYGQPNGGLGEVCSALKKSGGNLLALCASEPIAIEVIVL